MNAATAHCAATAQRTATVIGWVYDQPIPRTLLDNRLATLRSGKGAAALPAPESREGRQLVRWAAHVLFTEQLCAVWAAEHHLELDTSLELDALSELDALGAVQLGSITSAAWRTHPAVSAVYRAVIGDDRDDGGVTDTAQPRMRQQWLLRIASASTRSAAAAAEPRSIGWTTLADIPVALAEAARRGTTEPVTSGGTWHVVVVDKVDVLPVVGPLPVRRAGTALRAFARWLDQQRAESVRVADGFEHPGDPGQPDNTHQH